MGPRSSQPVGDYVVCPCKLAASRHWNVFAVAPCVWLVSSECPPGGKKTNLITYRIDRFGIRFSKRCQLGAHPPVPSLLNQAYQFHNRSKCIWFILQMGADRIYGSQIMEGYVMVYVHLDMRDWQTLHCDWSRIGVQLRKSSRHMRQLSCTHTHVYT